VNTGDQIREQMAELASEFYNGAAVLEKLAAWAYVTANQQAIVEYLTSFERAYEQLVQLHMAGKLQAGPTDMSEENLERVKRIIALLQPGLDSDEARGAVQEVHALAEQCLSGLKKKDPAPWEEALRVVHHDEPDAEIMGSLCACLNACAMLRLTPSTAQRRAILDVVSWFIDAETLQDLPTVQVNIPKDRLRSGAAVAARLKAALLAWDGTGEAPASLLDLARELEVALH
jgi:flagellin-specific chaperone FliS